MMSLYNGNGAGLWDLDDVSAPGRALMEFDDTVFDVTFGSNGFFNSVLDFFNRGDMRLQIIKLEHFIDAASDLHSFQEIICSQTV